MPATLVAMQAPTTVLAEELSNVERAVALYASDMPTGYGLQGPADPNVADWIAQGAARLGREETRRRASYLAGHRKLWLRDMTTPEIDRRHKVRFPSKRRLRIAESVASTSLFWIRVTPAARALPAEIDGPCPKCDDAGKLWVNQVIDDTSGWYEEGYVPCWVCQPEDGAA
ncbi:hypothetical protein OG895_29035 [Streptomyces sp. NBC_00201]|uniref:hypothetical protein n=1 Tax=Streptomyces sp. NBC_00201 TaxID=2975679 RepID=UPI00225304BD|nr:hypothetical protein [Streptomyces sp. NBC_00201]MCX5249219.1 hypothetical protein [Streptomyces sp. NBC_00201]